ncbi:UNVERIFIED_CONTAM: hypothetical protein Sradi_2934200 [Sesamum radiatum]|uniref:Uncharacterized protein n=1 Tax=Sesamum radiatum TaxID=300843 RepID=A0AAW2RZY5_SESRA
MLPAHVTDLDKKAYGPQVVSLGPYHHNKPHLKPMEHHKQQAFLHFIKRSEVPLERYAKALEEVVQDLIEQYDELEPMWLEDSSSFMALMIVDGCFILEILRMRHPSFQDYAPNDPYSVPLLLLTKLLHVEKVAREPNEYLNKLVFKFFHSGPYAREVGGCLHLLDIYQESLLDEPPKRRLRRLRGQRHWDDKADITGIPSATELLDIGIRFKRSKMRSLKDISIHQNTLRLPEIIVDYETKSRLLNLIAFERFHVGAGNEVRSYIFFLTSLIKGSQDVSLLRSCGIIRNVLGNDEDVAELFNLLRRDVIVDPERRLVKVYRVVRQRLRNRFRMRLYEWRADLIPHLFQKSLGYYFSHCCNPPFHPYTNSDHIFCFELQT